MFLTKQLPLSAARDNMRRLAWIRVIALLGQLAGVLFAWAYLDASVNYAGMLVVLTLMALVTVASLWRLRYSWLVTDAEYFAQLLVDVAALTCLLYFSGGSTNPFISYYLVILTICAATLPWSYTWCMTGVTFTAYSALLFYYQPLILPGHDMAAMMHGNLFNLHIVGMWLTFLISALLITYFVVKMAQAIRQREADLAAQRETTLHDEQLLAVATLAAGTAHELGTPLSTIAVLAGEMQQDYADNSELQEDLQLLQSQLQVCKQSMQVMVNKFSVGEQNATQPVTDYMTEILERWRLMRPDAHDDYSVLSSAPVPELDVDETMGQAIMSLLNNAADASPQRVDIELQWDQQSMRLSIRDYGAGITPELAEKLGKPFVSTKRKGLGLGLYLSHATVRRFNGLLTQYNHDEGGTLTELQMPIVWSQVSVND
jgi:two-component system, sensor histidine kinase RegB